MVLAPNPPLTKVNPSAAALTPSATFEPPASERFPTPWTPVKESLMLEAPLRMSVLPCAAVALITLAFNSAALERMKVVGA